MGRSWMIASGKGGVGKSTIAAALGTGLAREGRRVCVVDADIGLRDQDAILGVENRIVYDLVDVANKECLLNQALISPEGEENLTLLPAAQFQADLRQLRGLAGTGFTRHDDDLVLRQRLGDLAPPARDRQVFRERDRRERIAEQALGLARGKLLARDRIGKKPLVYRLESDRLLFASELKALKEFPGVPRDVDLTALKQYLVYQYVPYPRTIYRGTSKLPPASYLIWREGESPIIERYWRAEDVADFEGKDAPNSEYVERLLRQESLGAARFGEGALGIEPGADAIPQETVDAHSFYARSFEETKRELRRRLEDAVRVRMRCDVPFGAFLSGGVDSTVVVGLMRKFSAEKVRTFSIGFAQKEYDETPFAKRTAERFGTDHTEFFVEPDAEGILPRLVAQYDEPFADSSAIPTWYLCETTRREVTVALGGDGGDELFCGYDRYKAVKLSQYVERLPQFLRRFLAGPARNMLPNSVRQRSVWRRGRRFLETLGMDAIEQYLQWIAIFNRSRLDALLSQEFQSACEEQALAEGAPADEEARDAVGFLRSAWSKFSRRDLTSAISFADVLTYLPCDIMTKVDIASMRSSLETRAPLLDPNVTELALQ
ncbi:MAG: asparagine synthase-related protein, partial [Thermoguttaceae bacterium]